MDGINIDDLTIEHYLRLTQENQTPSMVKKVDDMTIAEYIKYEERIKRQYNRNFGSYFPTYSGHCTSKNNTTIEFPRNAYFNPIQPNTEFNYDYEDMELDEEDSFEEDLDEWLKAEIENHMSKQNEKNKEDALIAIIKSTREECRVVHKNKQLSVLEADLKKSFEVMDDTVNNDSFTSNLPYQPSLEELNLGNDMTQKETLGIVKSVLVKIDKFEFPCDFVVTDMPKNLGEMIILGRPYLETIHAQIDVLQEEISLGIDKDRIKFDVNGNPRQYNVTIKKIYMASTSPEEESFNPLEIGHDLFSYESPTCLQFE
ncbi:reverse transcriptase domain-containing protein [Tanacetum coccineum]|uniref:Reverse transcriptase domain-containing protein n=1 Tax=Tanacetum coccineum TaxID=301880 RepID=A0ABQ5ETJ3_9ASTR